MPTIDDLTGLTLLGFVSLTVLVAIADTAGSIIAAIAKGTFNLAYISQWVTSHLVVRVLPIAALGWLGHGVPALDVPRIDPVWYAALLALLTYFLETVASLKDAFSGTGSTPPADSSPVPPPV